MVAASATTHFRSMNRFINFERGAGSFAWLRLRRGVTRNQTHRPLNHLQPHLLKLRAFPDSGDMAEAVVEHAAFAEILRPNDGEIMVGALHALACEIELAGIETE